MDARCLQIETRLCVMEELFFQELSGTTDAERAGRLDEALMLIDAALEVLAKGTAEAAMSVLDILPGLRRVQKGE